jgi:hypothetical protein
MREHYGKSFSTDTMADWLTDLKGFKFIHISQAFDEYRQNGSKFAPKSLEIRNLAKKFAGGNAREGQEFKRLNECYVLGCKKLADERRGENVWMCGQHSEDWILKTQPTSFSADLIRSWRKNEERIKSPTVIDIKSANTNVAGMVSIVQLSQNMVANQDVKEGYF